jgi:hypothetical protein
MIQRVVLNALAISFSPTIQGVSFSTINKYDSCNYEEYHIQENVHNSLLQITFPHL